MNAERAHISELFELINPSYIEDKIKFIDLFAGIGGMRIAFDSDQSQCVFSS